jgi:amidase
VAVGVQGEKAMGIGKNAAATVLAAAASVVVAPIAAWAEVDVVGLTAKDVAAGHAAGTFTSTDLVDAYLKRIQTYEPYYNAFTYINPNARLEAQALDLELKASGPRSPLHGVPIVIKDSMNVAGVRTTAGFAGFVSEATWNGLPGLNLVPEQDAVVVARLRAAGAIIMGKTNLPVFARASNANNSYDGPTYNAVNRALTPGGSSSGSATATAGSFAVLGMAEETAGSIQMPAGAQGLVGVKTTFGLVPTAGGVPLQGSTRDVFGPVAKTVYDAAVTLDVIAGYSPADPNTNAAVGKIPAGGYVSKLSTTALQGKRIGLWGPGFKSVELTPETQAVYNVAVEKLKAQGAIVVENPFAGSSFASRMSAVPGSGHTLPYDLDQWFKSLGPTAAAKSAAEFKEKTGIDLFTPGLLTGTVTPELAEAMKDPSVQPDLSAFLAAKANLLAEYRKVIDDNDVDAFFFPQMWDKLPLRESGTYRTTTVSEINVMGVPGVNLSGGFYADGSPFSVMFMGDAFSEGDLLGLAYDYEQATPEFRVTATLVPEPSCLAGLALGGGALLARRRRRAA